MRVEESLVEFSRQLADSGIGEGRIDLGGPGDARRVRPVRASPATRAGPYFFSVVEMGGSAALIADTVSSPAIAQTGCEKSLASDGTGTCPT